MNDLKVEVTSVREPQLTDASVRRRSLVVGCGAHAVHDGLTDVIYVLLPIWQAQFALSYAQIGLLRGAYSAMMAGFQLLASRTARRWGRERMLVGGTALAGLAYLLAGQAGGLTVLFLALLLGGLGASTQHPLASSLITDTHEAGGGVKQALSQYNVSGDIGKTLIPGLVGLLLTVISWRASVTLMGLLGLAAAGLLWWLIPARAVSSSGQGKASKAIMGNGSASGLRALIVTGTLDSAVSDVAPAFIVFAVSIATETALAGVSVGSQNVRRPVQTRHRIQTRG